jgi:hypothetical protein
MKRHRRLVQDDFRSAGRKILRGIAKTTEGPVALREVLHLRA